MADSARPSNMRVQVSARFVSDEDLIADLVRVAALDDSDALTRERYNQQGNYHSATIHRRLGSWTAACEIAGLRSGRPDLGHSHEAWMRNLYEVWRRLGRQPSYGDMRDHGSRPRATRVAIPLGRTLSWLFRAGLTKASRRRRRKRPSTLCHPIGSLAVHQVFGSDSRCSSETGSPA
jgi:Homing endonuclease associated repeat